MRENSSCSSSPRITCRECWNETNRGTWEDNSKSEDQSDQVLQLVVEVQEKRIQEGDEIDEIQPWSLDIERRLEEFDETMDLLRKAIESLNEQTAREARQIEQKMED